jgi:hypothetical protein
MKYTTANLNTCFSLSDNGRIKNRTVLTAIGSTCRDGHKKIIFTVLLLICFLPMYPGDVLRSSTGKWEVEVLNNGVIKSLKMDFDGASVSIPWHSDNEYAGPSFGTSLHKAGSFAYEGTHSGLTYAIRYQEENGNLMMLLSVKNNDSQTRMMDNEASLRLGINHIMSDPANYYSIFFPTLLRCEQTHFWGYFQTPEGKTLAITSPDAIASWHIDYIGNGHRIATCALDLLNRLPLPARHPQELFYLAGGEEKKWKLILLPLSDLREVPEAIASASGAPAIDLERTTVSPGETVDFKVFCAGASQPVISVCDSLEGKGSVTMVKKHPNAYSYEMKAPEQTGTYEIAVELNGRRSVASIYVRKPWSWYLDQAAREALRMEQKACSHREAWMGFFSAYWAQAYFPDPKRLAETEQKFSRFWELMIDPQTGFYCQDRNTWHSRPQNTAWMLGMLTARYAATKDIRHLELAAEWADHLINKFQLPDGAFKGYTALTMGAKFLQELMWYETSLAKTDSQWKERYARHQRSVEAAAKNILTVKDMGETEGESTYEDTQVGSAWSLLAMHALVDPSGTNFSDFLRESLIIQKRHECLTQALIPDSRMRGGTLRWWEAQYDVLIRKNMMNSPHAWTMRSQFGAMYLYLLTGEEYFLNVAFNVMGTCSQSIDHHTGLLRWAFVPDPYLEIERMVPDYRKSGEGKYINETVGEQWLPMISDWWLVPEDYLPTNDEKGWSCDNDVHEHFRFLAEQFIPNAFVLEREDGTIRTWNCTLRQEDGKWIVTPAEDMVSRVHFNLRKKHAVEVVFSRKKYEAALNKGLQWVGPGLKDYRIPVVYLWKEMISK